MNIKNIFMAGMALLAVTACSSGDEGSQIAETSQETIRLTGTIGQQTRSSQDLQNSRFKVGTTVDVQITSTDGITTYAPLTYKVNNTSGTLVPTSGVYPYYPINGAGINVRAIYPVGYMNENSFTVESTQTDDASYMKSDLMFATATVTADEERPENVSLNFQHKLTKICVNLTPEGTVDLAGAQVKLLGMYTTVGFEPNTGAITTVQGSRSDMLIQTGGAESTIECAAIVVPQTFPGGYLLEIRLANNDILNYRSVQTIPFESGKKYTYNITVTESNIRVESGTIEPWIETTDIEGRPRL